MTDSLLMKLYDVSTEQAIIGSIVIEGNKLFSEIIGILDKNDFYKTDNQNCYKVLHTMF